MTHPCVQELLAVIQRQDTLRVWSLLMSFIGDVIAPEGGETPLTTLLAMTRHLGIEDGTVRVALSRLTRDDWLQRRRSGRHSHYRLSVNREREFRDASARIYACRMPLPLTDWCLALAPPNGPSPADATSPSAIGIDGRCIDAQRGIWLLFADNAMLRRTLPAHGWLLLELPQRSPPDWLSATLVPARLTDELAALGATLAALDRHPPPTGIDALACRCLLIHGWRRLALRIPGLPAPLLPPDWPEPACRDAVRQHWQNWLAASEAWLAEHGGLAVPHGTAHRQGIQRWHAPTEDR